MISTNASEFNRLSVEEAAKKYRTLGEQIVPLHFRTKGCKIPKWQDRQFEPDKFPEYLKATQAGYRDGDPYGVGLKSGDRRADVDLDCDEARAAAGHFLPGTLWVYGRPSNPRSHWLYATERSVVYEDYIDPVANVVLVELRGKGRQSVAPPSIHEDDNEPYQWYSFEGAPAEVPAAELEAGVARIAAASLLGRYWPKNGRHYASLSLAGGLLRAGWAVEDVETFVRAVADAANDEELRNRVKNVSSTAQAQANGRRTTGWPTLAESLGANGRAVVDCVIDWLGLKKARPQGHEEYDPWPDPIPLSGEPPVPPFPVDVLPPTLAEYCRQVAWATNSPVDYVGTAMIAASAGLIGNARRIALGREWPEPAIIFAALVGVPGQGKSPGMSRIMRPIDEIQGALVAKYADELAAWTDAQGERKGRGGRRGRDEIEGAEAGEPSAPKPQYRAVSVRNATIESIQILLNTNRNGFMVPADELAGFLLSLGQYKGGKGSDRQFVLSCWAQEVVDRYRATDVKQGYPPCFNNRPCLSIFGGIQPQVLPTIRGESPRGKAPPDDGGLDRFLFAWPAPFPAIGFNDRAVEEHVRNAWPAVVMRLFKDLGDDQTLRLSGEASRAWREFTSRLAAEMNDPEFPEYLKGPWYKLQSYTGRFALILHVLGWATGTEAGSEVSADVVTRAERLTRYYMDHCRKVHAMIESDPRVKPARKVVEWVRQRRLETFTRSDCYHKFKGTFRTVDRLDPILLFLEDCNVIRPVEAEGRVGRGRGKASPVYRVNPKLIDPSGDKRDEGDDFDGPPFPDTPGPAAPHSPQVDPHYPYSPHSNGQCDGNSPTGNDPHYPYSPHSERSDATQAGAEPGSGDSGDSGDHSEGRASQPGASGPGECMTPAYTLITDPASLATVQLALEDCPGERVFLDTETTGLDPLTDRVRLLQLAVPNINGGHTVYIVDCFRVEPSPLWPALSACRVVGHNLKFDLAFLARLGFQPGPVADTMLMAAVVATHANERVSLAACVERFLGRTLAKDEQASDWAGSLTPEQLAYAANDVAVLVPLYAELASRITAAKVDRVADIENRAVPAIAWMGGHGIGFDTAAWQAHCETAKASMAKAEAKLDAMAPARAGQLFDSSWDWKKPAHVAEALASLGHPVANTSDSTLASIDHPFAESVREHRAASKLAATYGQAWLKYVRPDGRIYADWWQMGAASGRMACSSPNLQQVPRDGRRKCFAASPGNVLLKADYSQIELRIIAKFTNDAALLSVYRDGLDLHTLTAQKVLHVSEVTKADRQLAKAVNFGFCFGMGAKGFQSYAKANYGLDLSEADAKKYRSAFFGAYPGLKKWHERTRREVEKVYKGDPSGTLETRTLAGRRRLVRVGTKGRDGVSYPNVAEALNSPIQGTGADGLKLALALLWERRAECPGAVPVLAVHDEIVVEVREADAPMAAVWLKAAMIEPMAALIAPVPVEVDVSIAKTWGGD